VTWIIRAKRRLDPFNRRDGSESGDALAGNAMAGPLRFDPNDDALQAVLEVLDDRWLTAAELTAYRQIIIAICQHWRGAMPTEAAEDGCDDAPRDRSRDELAGT